MSIDAVIFDMDGTLVDTEHLHESAWNIAAMDAGDVNGVPHQEYVDYAGRDGKDNALMIVAARPELDISADDLLAKKDKIFEENLVKNLKLVDGAKEVLQKCQDLGLKVALATGGPRSETETKILGLELAKYFEHVVTASEVENKKPHPQTYIDAYLALGVNPKYCIAIEDTEHGVTSAKDAGLYCIAKPTATTSSQDFTRADIIVDSLPKAMQHIEELLAD